MIEFENKINMQEDQFRKRNAFLYLIRMPEIRSAGNRGGFPAFYGSVRFQRDIC